MSSALQSHAVLRISLSCGSLSCPDNNHPLDGAGAPDTGGPCGVDGLRRLEALNFAATLMCCSMRVESTLQDKSGKKIAAL